VWCGVGGCGKERGGIGVGVGKEIDLRRSNCFTIFRIKNLKCVRFRFRWIIDAVNKDANASQIKAATKLNVATINSYVFAPRRQQAKIYHKMLSEIS